MNQPRILEPSSETGMQAPLLNRPWLAETAPEIYQRTAQTAKFLPVSAPLGCGGSERVGAVVISFGMAVFDSTLSELMGFVGRFPRVGSFLANPGLDDGTPLGFWGWWGATNANGVERSQGNLRPNLGLAKAETFNAQHSTFNKLKE
jgi:hypothetical protein